MSILHFAMDYLQKDAVTFAIQYNNRIIDKGLPYQIIDFNLDAPDCGTVLHKVCSIPSLTILTYLAGLSYIDFLKLDHKLQTCVQKIEGCFLSSKKTALKHELKAFIRIIKDPTMKHHSHVSVSRPIKQIRTCITEEQSSALTAKRTLSIRPSIVMGGMKRVILVNSPHLASTSVDYSMAISFKNNNDSPSVEIESHHRDVSTKMVNYPTRIKSATAKRSESEGNELHTEAIASFHAKKTGPAQPRLLTQNTSFHKTVSLKRDFLKKEDKDGKEPASTNLNLKKKLFESLPGTMLKSYESKTKTESQFLMALLKVCTSNQVFQGIEVLLKKLNNWVALKLINSHLNSDVLAALYSKLFQVRSLFIGCKLTSKFNLMVEHGSDLYYVVGRCGLLLKSLVLASFQRSDYNLRSLESLCAEYFRVMQSLEMIDVYEFCNPIAESLFLANKTQRSIIFLESSDMWSVKKKPMPARVDRIFPKQNGLIRKISRENITPDISHSNEVSKHSILNISKAKPPKNSNVKIIRTMIRLEASPKPLPLPNFIPFRDYHNF